MRRSLSGVSLGLGATVAVWNRPARRLAPMAKTVRAGMTKESAPVTIDTPVYSARLVELREITVAFERIKRGGDATPVFQGLRDDRCPCSHWGLVVSGEITCSYRDRDEVFGAGEVFYSPSGHLPKGEGVRPSRAEAGRTHRGT